ncbi:MAG: hypothetical protein GY928_34500 [Colwellia sp.]|nr:hypothetical protein [Colwellia sp.]
MGRLILVLVFVLMVGQGCFTMMSKALVPDVNPKMNEEELGHLSNVYTTGSNTLLSIVDAKVEDKQTKRALQSLDRMNKRANDIQPGVLQTGASQYLAMVGQKNVETGLREGFEWTKGLIGTAAGGATGVGGLGVLITQLLGRRRKREMSLENKILKETVSEGGLREKATDKAKHTEVEGKII